MKNYYSLTFVTSPNEENEKKDIIVSLANFHCLLGCEENEDNYVLYFETSDDARQIQQSAFEMGLPSKLLSFPISDWGRSWRESVQPVQLTPTVWVSPKWRTVDISTGKNWIKIEPQMAFGTGHHLSTQLPARAMEKYRGEFKNGSFLDVGSGSGILCLLASLLGAQKSIGLEYDLECIENCRENRKDNLPLSESVSLLMGNENCLKPVPQFHFISINMIRTLSQPLLPHCFAWLKPGGLCFWSGILREEKEKIQPIFNGREWVLIEELEEEDWWCGVLKKIP